MFRAFIDSCSSSHVTREIHWPLDGLSWFLTHIVFRLVSAIVDCQGDGRTAGWQDSRLAGWGVVAGCCFQFGFRSVHFSIYLLWLFVHHYVALCLFSSCMCMVGVCMCVSGFYAKSIFNLAAEHLCKYQILTTNTALDRLLLRLRFGPQLGEHGQYGHAMLPLH